MQEVTLDLEVSSDSAMVWRDDRLYLLDQRQLPEREVFIECTDVRVTAEAIRAMVVRGAPAIGITAAYGIVLAARERFVRHGPDWRSHLDADLELLAAARPTAVNLFWAIARFRTLIAGLGDTDPVPSLLDEAVAIHRQDRLDNRRMGEFGAELMVSPGAVITRRTGDRRLGHRTRCHPQCPPPQQDHHRLRGRDPALAAGRATDRLGAVP